MPVERIRQMNRTLLVDCLDDEEIKEEDSVSKGKREAVEFGNSSSSLVGIGAGFKLDTESEVMTDLLNTPSV